MKNRATEGHREHRDSMKRAWPRRHEGRKEKPEGNGDREGVSGYQESREWTSGDQGIGGAGGLPIDY